MLCSGRCLQPFGGCRHLATSRESKAHFGLPYGYAPGTIAVNVTQIEREFNACQTHRSMYLSIFNRFPVIKPVNLKVRYFSTFFCTFWPPLGTPLGQSYGKCYMDRKRIHCWSNASQHVPIYLQPFTRYWSEIATFSYPLHLTPQLGCSHWNSGIRFGPQNSEN